MLKKISQKTKCNKQNKKLMHESKQIFQFLINLSWVCFNVYRNSQGETRVNPQRKKRYGRDLEESFEFIFDNHGVKWGKCKLCLAQEPPIKKTFKMTASNTTGIKRHLRKFHQTEFEETYPLLNNSKKVIINFLFSWLFKKNISI